MELHKEESDKVDIDTVSIAFTIYCTWLLAWDINLWLDDSTVRSRANGYSMTLTIAY